MSAGSPREIELKLRAAPEALALLRDSALVRDRARAAARAATLVSTYWDTPDHRLAARGIALRLRKDGKRLVQTLKLADGQDGAAHDRAEWEVDVAGPRPDLAAFGDAAVLDHTGLVLPDELVPFFETRVRRETVLVEWPDGRDPPAVIEVAFDQGTIEAGRKRLPLAEVELELKEGRPRALFALADALRALAPLALEPLDKARRGYRLATGRAPLPRKAGTPDLGPSVDVEAGLQAILRAGLAHWLANEAVAADGGDPEGVHQLRVALRRLRSVLGLFADVLPADARKRWNGEMRWLLQSLGRARELDVLVGELLRPLDASPDLADSAAALRAVAVAARADAYTAVREALAARRYADLGLGFAAWIERHGWREGVDVDVLLAQRAPLRELARRTLGRGLKRALRKGRGFERLAAPARHEVRIALKRLRYAVEYFEPLFDPKQARPFAKRLAGLQDQLGHLNDVAVARRLVVELAATGPDGRAREALSFGAGATVGWYAASLGVIEPDVVESWREFLRAEPFWEDDAA